MPGVPKANAAQAPSAYNFAHGAAAVKELLARPKRKLIHSVDRDIVSNVIDAGPLIAFQAIHILRSGRFASSDRAVIDGVRPRITRLKREAFGEAPFQGRVEAVIGAGSDVVFVIDGTKRIS